MQTPQAPDRWQPVLLRVWMGSMGSLPVPQWALQARPPRGTIQKGLGPLDPLRHLRHLAWHRLRWCRRESRSHTNLSL